jgi:pimeloyl-ACP methyl ester carboxylesterase
MKTVLLCLLLLYCAGCAVRYFHPAWTAHDEVHYARTDDGALLALYRYVPANPDPAKFPAILAHGFTETRFAFDLPGRSLPRYLADQGREAWVVELRGQGDSRRAIGRPLPWQFDFDDHARRDVPAAIDAVIAKSGAPKVHWIGHSMGGMVLYAYLAWAGGDARIARGVTLGSPGTFTAFRDPLAWLVHADRLLRHRKVLATGFYTTFWLPLVALGLLRLRFLGNPENLRGRTYTTYLAHAIADVGMGVAAQFAHFIRTGTFTARVDGFDYQANFSRITTPLLMIAGGGDTLVRTFRVKATHDAVASPEKEYLRVGKRDGFALDYGHGDLTIGDRAPEEVWPRIAAWLAKEQ